MKVQVVDLYREFGLEKLDRAVGTLTCYMQNTDASRRRPAVLVIPGGGYGHVSWREGEPVAMRFLCRGYNAFVLDYAVAPVQFPVQLQEAAMAMGYLRKNADALGIHPAMVAAIGFSAGGHLCGTLGTMYDCLEVRHIASPETLRPDALGLCYPVAVSWGATHEGSFDNLCGENAALRDRLSLDKLVRPDMPPTFLWHTRDDDCVPCHNSLILAQAMEEAGVDISLHLYRHGPHGLSTADAQAYAGGGVPDVSPRVPDWPEEMMEFFRETGLCLPDEEAGK